MLTALKQPIKALRWRARRAAAARRWGAAELARAPIVIGNAMPKSGSHLLIQVLLGLTRLGPFVDPGSPPLTRSAANRNLPEQTVLTRLHELQPGDIAYAYLHARSPYLEELSRPGVAGFFIHRDPRDIIVSQIFYATGMHAGHSMRRYYTEQLATMEQRIDAAILGVQTQDAQLSPIASKYSHYLGWLSQPAVLCVRFEDLILDRQGALGRILDHLAARGYDPQQSRADAVEVLSASIAPRASGTFRKGRPGEWRQHFTEANKRNFKAATGDLLVRLGYEKDSQW
jgi:hypothetical protein